MDNEPHKHDMEETNRGMTVILYAIGSIAFVGGGIAIYVIFKVLGW